MSGGQLDNGGKQTVFGVVPIRQRFVGMMGACFYTGKTQDQLDHAVRKGHLRVLIAKDGSKSFCIDDLDEFMGLPADRRAI